MAEKISQYTAITTLANGDLMDISQDAGAGAYATKSISYADLLLQLQAEIGYNHLYGLYSQTVVSATINTVGEQSIVGSGKGSLTVPASTFLRGDSYHGKIGGLINATGGGSRSEIIIKIKTGTTILATTGIFDLDTATNQGWECELDFTIASVGATGSICTNGNFAYTKDGNRSVFGYIFQDVQPIDTTVSNTLDITVEWNVLNAGDDIYSANFVVYKTY